MKTTTRLLKVRPRYTAAVAAVTGLALVALAGCTSDSDSPDPDRSGDDTSYSSREVTDGKTTFVIVENPDGGARLSYAKDTPVTILEVEDGDLTLAFKDMNDNGTLDTWEDWREPVDARAAALAPELSTEQIAGLMLFSSAERSPADGLTDGQRTLLEEDNLRVVLSSGSNNVEHNVTFSNQFEAFVESLVTEETPYVPVSFGTDPRSDPLGGYSGSATAEISQWPGGLGMAATFNVDTVREFGQMASMEYRALGLTIALSPQIDVASDPRWMRNNGTFGEDAEMTAEMAEAFVEGFQETYDEDGNPQGWGEDSVVTVIKHLAGDAAGEGGRASYNDSGKYAVFPGDAFDTHLGPFEAALDSLGVMTNYSILLDGEGEALTGERVGSGFNQALVDIMRVDNDYDGVIMTDWGVTAGGPTDPDASWGTAWGVEDLTVDERHLLALKAGVDMFGGNVDVEPVLAAYDMWQDEYEAGDLEIDADARFVQSGERILGMLMNAGLYENPFVDVDEALGVVGSEDKVEAGYQAQLDSVVMLKNDGTSVCSDEPTDTSPYADATVYIPRTFDIGFGSMWAEAEYTEGPSVPEEVAEQYFGTIVTDEVELDDDGHVVSYTAPDLSDVDVVLVAMDSPNNGYDFAPTAGHDPEEDVYYPITAQYRPYTADGESVRQTSISGNILDDGTQENRSYYGKTSRISNEANLDSFERAIEAIEATGEDIPVITLLRARNPIIPAEFEADSDVLAVGFEISDNALIEVALGMEQSSGRLPIGFPVDMDAIEGSQEDVPFDVDSYVDSAGNTYSFGYGLGCDGKPIE